MISRGEIQETNSMIQHMNLDVRTITMGISLLDCADADIDRFNEKIYNKITTKAKDLVKVGKQLELELREYPLHLLPLQRQAVRQITMYL